MVEIVVPAMLALALAAGCPPPSQEPSFVPGEVIVKFAEGVPRTRGDFLEVLSRELGVPLRPAEATAGSELVLSIDTDRLRASLTGKLEADDRVESVETRTLEPRYVLEPPQTHFVVRLKDRALRSEPAALDFLKSLEKDLGAPLKRVDSGDELTLTIDIQSLTLDLVEKLKARPDVAYAQTNNLLHHQ
jgi:hypothetical protein